MSNLGLYQMMTIFAKKAGGPVNLFGFVALTGYAVLRTSEAGLKLASKQVKEYLKKNIQEKSCEDVEYTVESFGTSSDGLEFKIGDKFRVLEQADDAILIEKIGDYDNPYFVAEKFLKSISDYK